MSAYFLRRSAILGRSLPALALFWPAKPGADVRATRPLDSGSDAERPARGINEPEPAPFVALPGARLAADAGGSETFAVEVILPDNRRLDIAAADLRVEAGQVLVRAHALDDAVVEGASEFTQSVAPVPQTGRPTGRPTETTDFTNAGTDLASNGNGGSNVTIIEDKSSFGAIIGAGASLVGTLVVASAYADLSTELVQLSQTIAEDNTSAAASVDADEAADAPLDEAEDGEEDASGEDADTDGTGAEAENKAPAFIELTGTGSVSETAAAGTLTGVAVTAIDPEGASTTQSLSIRIEDDGSDAIYATPAYTQAHESLLSGALVFGSLSADAAFPDARFGFGGIETLSGDATVDLFLTAQEYFLSGPDSVETALSAPAFTILPEINLIELDKGTVMLGSYDTSGDYLMTFSVSETDFSGSDGFGLGLYAKSYHANASGVAEESYQFTDGSVTRFTEPVFFDNHPALNIEAGTIIHFADLTGDGLAELLVRPAGTSVLQAYENLGDGFARDALSETLFTGLDLDALAGGRLLDLSLRDHFSTGETTLVLLGTEATFLYELT